MVTSDYIFLAVIIGMVVGSIGLIILLNKMFGIKDDDD